MDLRIRGKTALVTGGSRGIGFGVAQLLAEEGCNLHLVSRKPENLEAARAKIAAAHKVEVACHAADLSESATATDVARRLSEVDILVNNAGSLAAMDDAAKELGDPERWRELTKNYPFGRIATVDEIASAIVLLASTRATYISGTC